MKPTTMVGGRQKGEGKKMGWWRLGIGKGAGGVVGRSQRGSRALPGADYHQWGEQDFAWFRCKMTGRRAVGIGIGQQGPRKDLQRRTAIA